LKRIPPFIEAEAVDIVAVQATRLLGGGRVEREAAWLAGRRWKPTCSQALPGIAIGRRGGVALLHSAAVHVEDKGGELFRCRALLLRMRARHLGLVDLVSVCAEDGAKFRLNVASEELYESILRHASSSSAPVLVISDHDVEPKEMRALLGDLLVRPALSVFGLRLGQTGLGGQH
jgi:hypothetical protein